ncbi:hypothetical protein POX_b02709 [Penicillium oxalicum]|uniref:Uncharacterized protein n=1 Tax=Penicillium oxalicum (strain 114-2 / CGMCC 5302) TaxID=933388 RepID=S7ZNN6_PENO1|nr:hypothetical protein POX_b02709 [Penicillium oxalicum]EPS30281.1 hypothetical protein PDE_05232 [Penicillium oxalicum 114-2]KAI2792669.1 hypothetical protein POX_b02709 [Penicillium oxalicum]
MIHLFTCSALLDQGLSGQPLHIPGGDCSIGLPTPLHFATQSPCWTVDKTLSVSPPGTRVPTAHGEHGEQGALPTFFGDALVEYLCRVLTGRSTSSSPGVSNIHKYTVPLVGIFGLRSAPAEGPPV